MQCYAPAAIVLLPEKRCHFHVPHRYTHSRELPILSSRRGLGIIIAFYSHKIKPLVELFPRLEGTREIRHRAQYSTDISVFIFLWQMLNFSKMGICIILQLLNKAGPVCCCPFIITAQSSKVIAPKTYAVLYEFQEDVQNIIPHHRVKTADGPSKISSFGLCESATAMQSFIFIPLEKVLISLSVVS